MGAMEIKILDILDMKLLGRKKVRFRVERTSRPTPSIWETRSALAAIGGFKPDGVAVVRIEQKSGIDSSEGEAHVYETEEEMRKWEPKHVILANMEPEARKAAIAEMKKKKVEAKAAKAGVKK